MRINYGYSSRIIDTTPVPPVGLAFDPTDMSNLWAWFDPTQGVTTVSGAVSQWVDAAFGVTVSQATAGNRPTFSSTAVNGFPGLTMTNAADHFMSSSTTAPLTMSCITIGSVTSGTGLGPTIISGGSNAIIQFRIDGNNKLDIVKQNTVDVASSTTAVTSATLGIWVFTVSNGSSGTYGFRINGTADASSGTNTNVFTAGTLGLFHNFSAPGTAETYNGSIGDIILTNVVSSTSDLQKAEGYLAWKYSQTGLLPAGHPYKGSPP